MSSTHLEKPFAVRSAPLDLLRTLAILFVFTSHYNIFVGDEWFRAVGDFGWIGVDLFFVLSGFLITSQLLKSRRFSLKEFYLRRGLRIWPNYFAVLVIYFCVPSFAERSTLPPLWKFLTFTQNIGLDFRSFGTFSHAWSLCVEEQFYIVLPLLLPLLLRYLNFRSAISIFITVIMGGIFLRSYLWHTFISEFYSSGPLQGLGVPYYREIYYPTYCRLDGLAVGVAIAAVKVLRPSIWERVNQNGNAFLTAGLAFLALALFVVFHEYSWHSATFGYPLLSLGFGGLVMAALARQGIFSKVKVPGAGFGATLAFAFYLTHKQMIHITKNFLVDANIAPQSFIFPLVIFVVCLISAVLLYITIERPFLLLRDRLLHSSRL